MRVTPSLRSVGITLHLRYYGGVRPSASLWYSRLAVLAACASPLTSKHWFLQFRAKACCPTHAPYTPVAVCPVIRHLTDLSQRWLAPLVSTTSRYLTTRHRGFTFARLSDTHLLRVFLLQPWLFTAAAWSGLRPAPESRSRGARPHLSRSFTTVLHLLSFRLCSTTNQRYS